MPPLPCLLALAGLAFADMGGDTASGPVPVAYEDADDDGWDVASGDCDDADPSSHPGADETCGDHADNDCDGFVDDGCTDTRQFATIQGGGCTSAPRAGTAALASVLLLLCRIPRRRPPGCR